MNDYTHILIINTTVFVENRLLWMFRPSAGAIVNAKDSLIQTH